MENDPFKYLINLKEASRICGLSSDHLRRLMENGVIKGKKIGRDWITTTFYVKEYMDRDIKRGRKPKHLE